MTRRRRLLYVQGACLTAVTFWFGLRNLQYSTYGFESFSFQAASTGILPAKTLKKINYVGVAGLGHRLIRMSSAYHLARILQISELEVFWRGYCPITTTMINGKQRRRRQPNVFEFLFDNSTMSVPTIASSSSALQHHLFPILSHDSSASLWRALLSTSKTKAHAGNITMRQKIKLVNEVVGYTHVYNHDKHHSNDNNKMKKKKKTLEPARIYGKLASDYEFYSQLVERFKFRHAVDHLFAPYYESSSNGPADPASTKKTTIIGIHIRAGNGELGDFEKYRQLGRGNLEGWLQNFTQLLTTSVLTDPVLTQSAASTVVFLATDTRSVVEYLEQNLPVPVIVTPQQYPTNGTGVSYNAAHVNRSTCLDSWKSQMMDMVGLSEYTDVLIAGQYSSFTQSLPLSRILTKSSSLQRQRFFCDVDWSAQALKCFDSRDGISNWWTGEKVHYVGAVDRKTFAGSQIFLPTELNLAALQEMVFFDNAS